jgi:hypothetical protein
MLLEGFKHQIMSMEPNKLDLKIKSNLHSREIQPSEMVWMLDGIATWLTEKQSEQAKQNQNGSLLGCILLQVC